MCEVPYVGPALGSWLLMAQDPDRYTVMDTRAVTSIRALGLMGGKLPGASFVWWLDYLQACKELAHEAGADLRTVDRALWAANGETSPPD